MYDEEPEDPSPADADGIEESIRRLRRMTGTGLAAVAGFLVLTAVVVAASRSFRVVIPPSLGPPPTPTMVSSLLVLYAFSAIMLILGKMMKGWGGCSAWSHVGYLAGFYGFYWVSGSLEDNVYAVVAAGLTILGLETYRVWSYSGDRIGEETEKLDALRRLSRWNRAENPGEKNVDTDAG